MGSQLIGICYGWDGNSLTEPKKTVSLIGSKTNIVKMRIYEPNKKVLESLKDSGIDVIVDVPKNDLEGVASGPEGATEWYNNNLADYVSNVKIKYIVVGRGVNPKDDDNSAEYVLPAMNNLSSVIAPVNSSQMIKVSTEIDVELLGEFKGPSSASFSDDVILTYIEPIVEFLDEKKTPLFATVRPLSHLDKDNDLDFALFRPKNPKPDPNNDKKYHSLFDWLLDALYTALDKIEYPDVKIVVARSGWPFSGSSPNANPGNAGTFYTNLLARVNTGKGTPLKPDQPIETYLYAMYDKNKKGQGEIDKYFGIFTHDGKTKYPNVPPPK